MPTKLVVIGDSLSQGVISGSITKTQVSYPALIAEALGLEPIKVLQSRNENYFLVPDFEGEGGLPVNMENILRLLVKRYGQKVSWLDVFPAFLSVRSLFDRVEDYWERGEGTKPSLTGPIHHNLASLGFQLGDCDTITEAISRENIPESQDDFVGQIPEFAMYRTARRTLNPRFEKRYENLSQVEAAKALAVESGGIENLIFWLGSNNCLSTVINLKMKWSSEADLNKLAHQRTNNIWRPEDFQKLLTRIAPKIDEIGAKNVFVGTIPHVTIPPVSRGVSPGKIGDEALSADGYFEYYTHFWIWDEDFAKAPRNFPHLTREQAREIDNVIDQYNSAIAAEAEKRGWYAIDICSALDRIAFRRRQGAIAYNFPPELIAALKANPATKDRVTAEGRVLLDTRYLHLDLDNPNPLQKYEGGLFGIDGFHPTTVGYGLIAHEFLQVMKQATDTQPLNWDKIVAADSLLVDPPLNLKHLRSTLGFLYHRTPLLKIIEVVGGTLTS
ncbi:hypothetical protein [Oscillatoria salina]|uniref:hypothetical protein n=1 Tax=Oscillatoria salina TaxID=331517 RepID=UPI0013BA39E6|nr:hypothetical protein [Oscillatoria salina]MBZ8182898.1 hypothetical protein [Oscillatoria salina IIICB1]NET88939.1 hypothetical protein [Kamptonema sp. SIO1D9]